MIMDEQAIISKIHKKNKKILLIHPSFRYTGTDKFPLGLGYVAASLEKMGNADINIVDEQKYQIGKEKIERKYKPDIIGITSTTPSFPRVIKLLTSVNKIPKKIRPLVILGGIHPTYKPEEGIESGASLVVRGESENIIKNLFQGNYSSLEEISGISWFDKDLKMIKHNPPENLIENIDEIPFPARNLFKKDFYPVMSLTTSRGCPYDCNYCSATTFWQNHTRFHSTEYIIKELESIASLGYKLICFEDATFSVNFKRAEAICNAMIENKRINSLVWSCETRPDRINTNLLNKFEESHCVMINLGVESASEKVLKQNNRTVKIEDLVKSIEAIKETKVTMQLMLIFGLPGESESSINETINFLKEHKPDRILLSLATAYPGTKLCTTTRRIDLPFKWKKKFIGHGGDRFSPLYFPEEMDRSEYVHLADKLLKICQQINLENQKSFRKKQDLIIKESNQ